MSLVTSPGTAFYVSQRLRLHYSTWGDPSAPPLLLVHGMQDHCRTWDWLVEHYVRDYFVVAPDLRGHGDSAWSQGSGYHLLDYVYDLTVLVRTLELSNLTVVGHSLGGTLAAIFAAICPRLMAHLVCIEGVGLVTDEQPQQTTQEQVQAFLANRDLLAARAARSYPNIEAAMARMRENHPNLSIEQARHLCLHGLSENDDGTLRWKFDSYTLAWPAFELSQEQTVDLWRSVSCPVLLMNAAQGYEGRIGYNGSVEHFSNARLVVIEDAGHWTYHDQLGAVVAGIDDFLARG